MRMARNSKSHGAPADEPEALNAQMLPFAGQSAGGTHCAVHTFTHVWTLQNFTSIWRGAREGRENCASIVSDVFGSTDTVGQYSLHLFPSGKLNNGRFAVSLIPRGSNETSRHIRATCELLNDDLTPRRQLWSRNHLFEKGSVLPLAVADGTLPVRSEEELRTLLTGNQRTFNVYSSPISANNEYHEVVPHNRLALSSSQSRPAPTKVIGPPPCSGEHGSAMTTSTEETSRQANILTLIEDTTRCLTATSISPKDPSLMLQVTIERTVVEQVENPLGLYPQPWQAVKALHDAVAVPTRFEEIGRFADKCGMLMPWPTTRVIALQCRHGKIVQSPALPLMARSTFLFRLITGNFKEATLLRRQIDAVTLNEPARAGGIPNSDSLNNSGPLLLSLMEVDHDALQDLVTFANTDQLPSCKH
eukprot:GHVT01022563.1.p1 GENE.GHVT01022563.1~~GHVT01022563.1.p1  ORF type:complete len:418 (+),score=16.16 GHVT01022563.1:299-1552(+)